MVNDKCKLSKAQLNFCMWWMQCKNPKYHTEETLSFSLFQQWVPLACFAGQVLQRWSVTCGMEKDLRDRKGKVQNSQGWTLPTFHRSNWTLWAVGMYQSLNCSNALLIWGAQTYIYADLLLPLIVSQLINILVDSLDKCRKSFRTSGLLDQG